MRISIIAAVAENGVIGREGQLPWRLPDDLRRFKQLTMGHTLVMGRKTWDSIGRPLPGRRMVVITRQPSFHPDGVEVALSLDGALAVAKAAGDDEAFVIGGAQVYQLALPRADRLYLTRVRADVSGDAHFPEVDWSQWQRIDSDDHPADADHEFAFTFETYCR